MLRATDLPPHQPKHPSSNLEPGHPLLIGTSTGGRSSKRQFGHMKVRYRALAKNTALLHTLFALSNLWIMRRTLLKEMRG